jgi:multiple sugar transport system substrate-binding protein
VCAVFPSFIYFNKDLFDAAGLPYPPQQYGGLYQGQPWDMEALRQLGMRLTLDANGKNATEPGFDPQQIVQFGFVPQWNEGAINEGAFIGPGDLTGPNDEATIPEAWKEAWRWFYQARHVDHFVPNAAYASSDAFGQGNVWSSGRAARAWTHLWYTCCFTGAQVPSWDIAVVPSCAGATTAKLHADTFAIMRGAEYPDAAFSFYLWLLQHAALRALYGGLPAIKSEQPAYFKTLDTKFAPNQVRWQVALDSLAYADTPSHEQTLPNDDQVWARIRAFDQLLQGDPALDLDAAIDQLQRDLTNIFRH